MQVNIWGFSRHKQKAVIWALLFQMLNIVILILTPLRFCVFIRIFEKHLTILHL